MPTFTDDSPQSDLVNVTSLRRVARLFEFRHVPIMSDAIAEINLKHAIQQSITPKTVTYFDVVIRLLAWLVGRLSKILHDFYSFSESIRV